MTPGTAPEPASRPPSGEEIDDAVDRSPARVSVLLSIGAALLALLVLPPAPAGLLGVPGTALLGVGALRGNRKHVTYGAAGVLLATTVAGVVGARPEVVLSAALLSVLAWDLGRYGITVGEQLGRAADTTRIEVAHATLTAGIGVAGAAVAYAAFLVTTGGQPVVVFALLLFGGFVVLATLR